MNTGLVVIGNIFARASSHGLQARPGGAIVGNLFVGNAISLLLGSAYVVPGGARGSIVGNVFLAGDDIDASNPRGTAVNITNIGSAGLVVRDNVIAHDASSQPYGMAFQLQAVREGLQNITLERNVVYDWRGGIALMNSDASTIQGVTIKDNELTEHSGRLVTSYSGVTFRNFSFSSNKYLGPSGLKWFVQVGLNDYSLDEWKQLAPELDAVSFTPVYPDPTRDIVTYNQQLNETATIEAFLARARSQSRLGWNPDYSAAAVIDYIRAGFGLSTLDAVVAR
jgi:parallel beta-helix repeat protein